MSQVLLMAPVRVLWMLELRAPLLMLTGGVLELWVRPNQLLGTYTAAAGASSSTTADSSSTAGAALVFLDLVLVGWMLVLQSF